MIKVRYPNEKDYMHSIEINKVERIENDGTFLVTGKENGYNVRLHLSVDPYGRFSRIPHTSLEYVKLLMPVFKKIDVTKSLKAQLDGMNIDTIEKKEKSNETIQVFYHPTLRKIYVTKETAFNLGYINNYLRDSNISNIIYENTNLDFHFFELTNFQFDTLKDKYRIELIKFVVAKKEDTLNPPYNDLGETYIDSEIKMKLMEIKDHLEKQGKVDDSTRNIIIGLINRERSIANLPKDSYKEEMTQVLYYDLLDLVSTVQGLNLSKDRVQNYNRKVSSLTKILKMRERDLDLSNVIELLEEIKDNMNEAYALDNIIEPRTWYLIESFVNNLVNTLLITDPDKFRSEISTFNKNNVTYGQIIYELHNYIEGRNQRK